MDLIKWALLLLIFVSSSYVGLLLSNSYKNRVIHLKEMKKALSIFKTKILYTGEPLGEIFEEISISLTNEVGNVFGKAADKMNDENAKIAWDEAIYEAKLNFKKEDQEVLLSLGKLLGKTDVEGQVSQIELTDTFLETQIEKAEMEYRKNEKLYKTLGVVSGLALVIVLI